MYKQACTDLVYFGAYFLNYYLMYNKIFELHNFFKRINSECNIVTIRFFKKNVILKFNVLNI